MTYKDLPQFLEALEQRDLLDTIDVEVDPILEITEIADRVSKQYGKALKFTHVKGSKYPLVINSMGTYERLNLGLGVANLDEIAEQIEAYMNLSTYVTLKGKIKAIPKLAPLPFIFPKKVTRAPCQEVVEEPNLNTLPIIKCWPQDGGKYITLPLVFTKDPETGQQNVGMYRLQVYDEKTTGMHWHLHKDGRQIYEKYRRLCKKMPVSVAIGCDPATIYAATAPLPKMIDEMIFAGYLKKKPIEMTKCITNEIYVPAHAEFVLEGTVDLDELRMEGPFGDHTGYYSLSDLYPVFHIEKITHKKNPIYPTTIVGKPPMEDCYLGKATERIFLPLIKIQCPEIIDMDFPLEGVFHNCAIVSIKKAFPLHGNKILNALWGLGQMMYTKMVIVVDEFINAHDYKAVLEALLKNVHSINHLIISEGPLDALDHASNRAFQGFRLGIDATQKLSLEVQGKSIEFASIDALLNQVKRYIQDKQEIVTNKGNINNITNDLDCEAAPPILIKAFSKKEGARPLHALKAMAQNIFSPNFIVLVDEGIDPLDFSMVAWKIFNNIDANRDLIIESRKDGTIFIGIDATKKGPEDGLFRPWPDDIEMSKDIVKYVDERWVDYDIY